MATQNVAPPSRSAIHKGAESSRAGPKDGHSVANRLQQDLTKLMVGLSLTLSSLFLLLPLFSSRTVSLLHLRLSMHVELSGLSKTNGV